MTNGNLCEQKIKICFSIWCPCNRLSMYAQYFLCGPHDVHAWLIAVYIASNIQKKKYTYKRTNEKKNCCFSFGLFWNSRQLRNCFSQITARAQSHTHLLKNFYENSSTLSCIFPHHSNGAKFFSDDEKNKKQKKSSANKMFPFSFFFFFKFINTIPLFAFTMPQIISINAAEKNTIQRQHTIYNFDK